MKHGTMSLRDRAAAWAFALFSAAALLAVAAQVFLGARPLQGMLPPWTRSRSSMSPPPTRIWSGSQWRRTAWSRPLGELRVAWRGPYQAIRYERGQHTYHIDLFRTYEPLGDVVLYENGFLCFEGSLFRVEEGAAYQRCLELCREALPLSRQDRTVETSSRAVP